MNFSKSFQRSQRSIPPDHSHISKFFTIYVMQSAQFSLTLLRRSTTYAILAPFIVSRGSFVRRDLNSFQRIQRHGKIHHAQRRGRYAHRGQRLHPAGWRGHHPQAGAPPRQAICNTVNIPCEPFLVVRRPLIITGVIRFVLHRPDDLRAVLRHLNAADKLGGHGLFLHGPAGVYRVRLHAVFSRRAARNARNLL